jgi:hypothetical protein
LQIEDKNTVPASDDAVTRMSRPFAKVRARHRPGGRRRAYVLSLEAPGTAMALTAG